MRKLFVLVVLILMLASCDDSQLEPVNYQPGIDIEELEARFYYDGLDITEFDFFTIPVEDNYVLSLTLEANISIPLEYLTFNLYQKEPVWKSLYNKLDFVQVDENTVSIETLNDFSFLQGRVYMLILKASDSWYWYHIQTIVFIFE